MASWPEQLNALLERKVRRIVLVGPSGAGKTYWTRSLVRKRKWNYIAVGSFSELVENNVIEHRIRSLLDFSGKVITDTSDPVAVVQKVIVEDGADSWSSEDHEKLSRVMDKNTDLIWVIHAWNLYANGFLKSIKNSKSWIILQVPPYGIRMLQSIAPEVPADLVPRAQGSAWAILRFQNDIKAGSIESLRDSFYGPSQVFYLQDDPIVTISKIRDPFIVKLLGHLNYPDMTNKFRSNRIFADVFSDADRFDRSYMTNMSMELIVRSLYLHGRPMQRLNYWTTPRSAMTTKVLRCFSSRAELDCPSSLQFVTPKMIMERDFNALEVVRPSRKRKGLPTSKASSKKQHVPDRDDDDN
jgi:hypothetical protein